MWCQLESPAPSRSVHTVLGVSGVRKEDHFGVGDTNTHVLEGIKWERGGTRSLVSLEELWSSPSPWMSSPGIQHGLHGLPPSPLWLPGQRTLLWARNFGFEWVLHPAVAGGLWDPTGHYRQPTWCALNNVWYAGLRLSLYWALNNSLPLLSDEEHLPVSLLRGSVVFFTTLMVRPINITGFLPCRYVVSKSDMLIPPSLFFFFKK